MSRDALRALWCDAALPAKALERATLPGADPVVPSSFRVAAALQASLGAAALAAAEVGRLRGGPAQRVSIEAIDVVRECSARFTLDGRTPPQWDPLSGLYRCGGEDSPGWVRLHANFAHHRDAALALLGLPPGSDTPREAVTQALREWSAEAFEAAAAGHAAVAAAVRTPVQWREHPQAAAVAAMPLVAIDRIGDAPPLAWGGMPDPLARPLRGLRVLDLSRILAGPVAGRTLAAYGADVMLVNGLQLPNIDAIADTSRGKLSAHLDLTQPAGCEALRALARDADIVLDAYRPGSLSARGLGPKDLARERPGIVCLSLSAYGHAGPWEGRRGFDSLVQSATGLNVAEGNALGSAQPRALPLQALDYGAGFLLAFGALTALMRQRGEGGSWLVRISLAGVARWLESLGRVSLNRPPDPLVFDNAMEASDSGFGRLVAARHAARFSHTPPGWTRPSMPPGTHSPSWPPL